MFLGRHILLVIFSLQLIGCVSLFDGDKDTAKQEVNMYLFSDEDTNKDVYGDPSPTRVTFLQLESLADFKQINEINSNGEAYKESLGDVVIDEVDMTIRPDEMLKFKLQLKEKTTHLGIIAAYRENDNNWKLSLVRQKPPKWQKDINFLYINVNANNIKQLTKNEVLLKIAKKNLEKTGKDFEKLPDFEKMRLLEKVGKSLRETKTVDTSRGIFLESK